MNIAAVVILYHPDEDAVKNILTYCSFVGKLYVADNTETSSGSITDSIRSHKPDFVYIHDGENKGISERLNQACKMAIADGYEYILTMDQDSSFKQSIIENYLSCFNNYPSKENVSMFGVQFENVHWAGSDCNPVPWTTLITSGSIVNLSLFEEVGGFDEQLFIDTVDFEYCFRSIIRGFKVILFKNILLSHNLGITQVQPSKNSTKIIRVTFHSPLRLYYMVRNHLYLKSKYNKQFPGEMLRSRNAIINRIKTHLMHDRKKFTNTRFIIEAILDYKKNRMGKYRKK